MTDTNEPLFMAALVVLLEEKGGAVTFTDADYQAIKVKYGGVKGFTINAEAKQPGDGSEPRSRSGWRPGCRAAHDPPRSRGDRPSSQAPQ